MPDPRKSKLPKKDDDKSVLGSLFGKKKEEPKKATKKTVKPKTTVKKTPAKKKASGGLSDGDAKITAFKEKAKASDAKAKKAEELMKSKTHQDLINAAYKAAEELKIAPWVLLRAAGWGHFTEDRGKKYKGPMIDDIEGLDAAQKKALKKAVGL